MSNTPIRVEVNGHTATAENLQHPALINYGHFTAMQVRHGRTRGLDLHLSRLEAATQELFNADVDSDLIRDHVRHALGDTRDASLRISIFWPETDDTASIMVAVRSPVDPPATPQRLKSVQYQRPVPHIKHAGSFGQIYYGLRAERDGFHDALLTGPDGSISESTISNVAMYDGAAVIWPDAPCLAGITMQLLQPRLAHAGLRAHRRTVRLADLSSFTAAFATNSLGIAPIDRIDDTAFTLDADLMMTITEIYQAIPWDPI